MESKPLEKYSVEEWEHFRDRFSNSALKTTEIAELGRTVGISWPFKGSGETPERYIQFGFEELQSVPGLIGKKRRIKDLMDVLREILAFDDPFSDMMDTVEKKNGEDQIYERVLKKMKIPESYPVNLMFFSPATRDLLYNNNVKTLIEAINYGKATALKAKGSNDLQSFINGLALINESTIMKHLPFRIGSFGLHLSEATGLLVRDLPPPIRTEFLDQAGLSLTDSEASVKEEAVQSSLEASLKVVLMRFNELCSWFDQQVAELKEIYDGSYTSIERYFLPINDPEVERVSIALFIVYFGGSRKSKGGILGKVSNLFKR